MSQLTGLARQGKGKIAVLLPETSTSARYTAFDAPYLRRALQTAGLSSADFLITNAQGSSATERAQAESAMRAGATVLVLDPVDKPAGKAIEAAAKAHGVKVIDYDRLTLGGSRDFYVSFDNVKVGELIGQGFVDCVDSWKVSTPRVLVMRGDRTDNNATLYSRGYDGVLAPKISSGAYVRVGDPAGTWDPPTAARTFREQYAAHKEINAVLMANDATAAAVIDALKALHTGPGTVPVTGQDAQLSGLRNVLTGYQCGTVYKPIYIEAQAAAALAIYLRAGVTPPTGLVNGQVADSDARTQVPSTLLTPVWVTSDNMSSTVVKDDFVDPATLCAGPFAAPCATAGIS